MRAAKIAYVGWAFFALTVVVLALWVLGRGIYIGADYEVGQRSDGSSYIRKICHYQFLNGTEDDMQFGDTYEEAAKVRCNMLMTPI